MHKPALTALAALLFGGCLNWGALRSFEGLELVTCATVSDAGPVGVRGARAADDAWAESPLANGEAAAETHPAAFHQELETHGLTRRRAPGGQSTEACRNAVCPEGRWPA